MERRLRRVCPWARSILALALVTVVLLQLSRCVFARDLLPLPVLDPFQADIARVHAAAFRHGIIRPDGAEASVSHCSHSPWQFPLNCSNRSRTRLRPHPSSQVTLPQLHWRKPHPAWRQHQLHRHRKKCSTEVVENTICTIAAVGQRRQELLVQLPDLGRTRSYCIQRSDHN